MNIYVGNLSRTVTEETLKALFEKFGQVLSVTIIKDKFTGEPRGFAFVKMADQEGANSAIEQLNGYELEGRQLRINEARPREDRPQRTGGPARRGPGGFGGGRGGSSRF